MTLRLPTFVSIALSAVALLFTSACSGDSGSTPTGPAAPHGGAPSVAGVDFDGPSTMSAFDRGRFERGRAQFQKKYKPSEGLGPLYNAVSCESCHSAPTLGGSAPLYRNFYVAMAGEPNTPLQPQFPLPGLPSLVVPAFGDLTSLTHTLTGGRPTIPATWFGLDVHVAQRGSIPTFGVGLFEFVSDATIVANSDPDDLDGDGISGRYNTEAGAIGRFGIKAQANNIESFTRAPLMNQMGISSNPFRGTGSVVSLGGARQGTANPFVPLIDSDGVPDPEIAHDDLGDLIFFASNLPAPKKQPLDAAATHGEQLFGQIGCVLCHVPSLPSTRGPVEAYTDLLLHDMGPALADQMSLGIPQSSSISPEHTGDEFRTAPLWGVSSHPPFLHDGRAETLEEAILAHGGEATAITATFQALSPADRDDLITFLEKL
ncbi:MAG: di-heme oxidoredictase family protein [Planctomycetota bacterium]